MAISGSISFTENWRIESSVAYAVHTVTLTSANYTQPLNSDVSINLPTATVKYNTSSGGRGYIVDRVYVRLLNSAKTAGFNYGYIKKEGALAANVTATMVPDSGTVTTKNPNLSSLFNSSNANKRTVDLVWQFIIYEYGLPFVTRTSAGYDVGRYSNDSSTRQYYNVTAGTLTLNAPPTFNVVDSDGAETTHLEFDTDYICTGLTTATISVSDLTAQYGGTISSATLKIGNKTVSRATDGELSMMLTEAGTFTPTITVTDSRGQTTTKTLDAITVIGYTAPSVVFTAERTTSTGKDDDEGAYAIMDATFTFTDAAAKLTAPTVTIDGSPATVTWYSTRKSDGTVSGTVNWSTLTSPATVYGRVSVPNIQTSYTVVLTPKDTQSSGTAITQTIASAFYTIDFLAGGHGIAFGRPSSDEGFWCDMDAHFSKDAYFKDKANAMRALFDFVYPIGSYYETSDTSFDPNVTWGGTWISETILDDEIVEEGTSGIWTYRKWSSGVYEVWGKTTNSCAMTNAFGSTYYGSVSISIAGLGFVEIKDMQITGQASGAYFATKIDNLTANTLTLSCRASNSNTISVTHYVRITGTWKTYTAPTETYRWHRTA